MKIVCLLIFLCSILNADNNEVLVIDGMPFGFFFNFYCVIAGLNEVEQGYYRGISPEFGESHLYYDATKGPNWWYYYFDKTDVFNQPGTRVIADQLGIFSNIARWDLPKSYSHYLLKKYVRIKANIQEEIDEFCLNHFQGHMIGIHYRGTDKWREVTSTVQYQEMLDCMKFQLHQHPNAKFFIATDEDGFIQAAMKNFKGKIVFRQQKRSARGTPTHEDKNIKNYLKGKEALIDCVLLSRCDTLIRTSSNLSDASLCFNPKIELINDLDRDVMLGNHSISN